MVKELAEQFDFDLTTYEKTLTLGDLMSYHIGGYPQPGDMVTLIKFSLVVVELEGDKIKRAGLYLASELTAEFERIRKAQQALHKSKQEDLRRRSQAAAQNFLDSIDDDSEYN